MPVPKRKTSRARRDSRQANKGIKPKSVCLCSNCGAPLASHQACADCGFYKGSKVLKTKNDRTLKRTELRQAKEARQKEKQGPEQDGAVEANVEEIKK